MTDMSQRGIHVVDVGAVHTRRRADQDYRNLKRARGREFAVSRRTAAVLGDDPVYSVRQEQTPLSSLIERTPRLDVVRIRQAQRRLDRVHRPNEIPVLRRVGQSRQPMTANGDEYAPRRAAERLDRSVRALDFSPLIPRHGSPGSPPNGEDRRPGHLRSRHCVLRHVDGEGMSRIDEQSDTLLLQIPHETLDAAKAAMSGGDSLLQRLARATRKRQCHLQVPATGNALRQLARLGGSTQNQNVRHVGR